jgi:hypothetical protein
MPAIAAEVHDLLVPRGERRRAGLGWERPRRCEPAGAEVPLVVERASPPWSESTPGMPSPSRLSPTGTRPTEFLERYARVFNTVEGNTTSYNT